MVRLFPPVFVANTKMILRYDFVAPLRYLRMQKKRMWN